MVLINELVAKTIEAYRTVLERNLEKKINDCIKTSVEEIFKKLQLSQNTAQTGNIHSAGSKVLGLLTPPVMRENVNRNTNYHERNLYHTNHQQAPPLCQQQHQQELYPPQQQQYQLPTNKPTDCYSVAAAQPEFTNRDIARYYPPSTMKVDKRGVILE